MYWKYSRNIQNLEKKSIILNIFFISVVIAFLCFLCIMNVGIKLVHKCSSSSVETNGGGDVFGRNEY